MTRKFKLNKTDIIFEEGEINRISFIDPDTQRRVSYSHQGLEYDLVEMGILSHVKDDSPKKDLFLNPVKSMAVRLDWSEEKVMRYLKQLYKISPSSVKHLILKEMAINLDKFYGNHISKSPAIYGISTIMDDVIVPVPKDRIQSFKNFAAFRDYADAITALAYYESIIEEVDGKDCQQEN
jgi:hypothetical protein